MSVSEHDELTRKQYKKQAWLFKDNDLPRIVQMTWKDSIIQAEYISRNSLFFLFC